MTILGLHKILFCKLLALHQANNDFTFQLKKANSGKRTISNGYYFVGGNNNINLGLVSTRNGDRGGTKVINLNFTINAKNNLIIKLNFDLRNIGVGSSEFACYSSILTQLNQTYKIKGLVTPTLPSVYIIEFDPIAINLSNIATKLQTFFDEFYKNIWEPIILKEVNSQKLTKGILISANDFKDMKKKIEEIAGTKIWEEFEDGKSSTEEHPNKPCENKYHLNQILYGPPGTGKTYHTVRLAAQILTCDDSIPYNKAVEEFNKENGKRLEFITFHQNFSYEDFIQGIRPKIDEKNKNGLQFTKHDGIFKKIADKAKDNRENSYVLIIDEINRANISRVFGELITLIEKDKRWNDDESKVKWKVTLPSGDSFDIPDNLFIIGTMNTADKSIALLDVALRRRFTFIPMYPLYHPDVTYKNSSYSVYLKKLNEKIVEELKKGRGNDLQIGHSYFMELENEDDFIEAMNNKVIPLLMEYFMNNVEDVETLVRDSLKEMDFEIIGNSYPIQIKKKTTNSGNDDDKKSEAVGESETEPTINAETE